ncbi:MAG: hypothetical protein JWL63_522 [Rhodocyclales bacterium]|nr:hypothetical protein [Rhodocyclales bacterium]
MFDIRKMRLALLLVLVGGGGVFVSACDNKSASQAELPKLAPVPAAQIAFTVPVNDAPTFDTQGHWSDGYKVAIGHGVGVVVGPGGGNPNVFAQTFGTKFGEPFKLIARAAAVDQSAAVGRFQINWADEKGNFLEVWSQTFDLLTEEKKFEAEFSAPSTAATGTLYVVGDGNSVVRYTEMRLLGKTGRIQ